MLMRPGPDKELGRAHHKQICVGDVGGVIIPANGINKRQQKLIADMNDRWTGVHLDDLRRCARRLRCKTGSAPRNRA